MTDSDALLHEVNRRAHEVARAARDWLKVHDLERFPFLIADRHARLERAVQAYEEADRRAQMEASL